MPSLKPPRPRNALLTRQQILEAAQHEFAELGFDAASLRLIAGRAGADPALIIRYFGSKEELFADAFAPSFSIDALFDGDRTTLGHRLAQLMLQQEARAVLGPIFALLRSTTNEKATQLLRSRLEHSFCDPLTAYLQGEQAQARAGMIVAILLGFTAAHALVRTLALTEADPDLLTEMLGRTLQSYID